MASATLPVVSASGGSTHSGSAHTGSSADRGSNASEVDSATSQPARGPPQTCRLSPELKRVAGGQSAKEGESATHKALGSASQQDRYDASQSESQSTGSGAAHSPGTATSAPPPPARTPEHAAARGAAQPLSTLDRPLTADVSAVDKRRTPEVEKRPVTADGGGIVDAVGGGGTRTHSSPAHGVDPGERRTGFGVDGKGTPRQVDEDIDPVMPSAASSVRPRQGEMRGEAGGPDDTGVGGDVGTSARMSIPKLNLLHARASQNDTDPGAAASSSALCSCTCGCKHADSCVCPAPD